MEESSAELSVEAVPCAQPHRAEVLAIFDLPEGDWPGLAALLSSAAAPKW